MEALEAAHPLLKEHPLVIWRVSARPHLWIGRIRERIRVFNGKSYEADVAHMIQNYVSCFPSVDKTTLFNLAGIRDQNYPPPLVDEQEEQAS